MSVGFQSLSQHNQDVLWVIMKTRGYASVYEVTSVMGRYRYFPLPTSYKTLNKKKRGLQQ